MTATAAEEPASRAISNASWSVLGRLLQAALTLICSPFIVGWFGERTYGLLAIGLVTIGVLGFADLGLTAAATRELAVADGKGDREGARRIFATVQTVYMSLALLFGGGLLLLAPLLAERLFTLDANQLADGRFVLRMAGVGLGLNLLTASFMSVPQALQRFDRTTRIAMAVGTYATAGLMICAWQGALRAAVLWQLSSSLFSLALLARLAWKLRPQWFGLPAFHRATFGLLAVFAGYQFLNQVMGSAVAQADRLIVAAYLPTRDITYYQVTGGIAQRIHVVIAAAAGFVFPRVAELSGRGDERGISELYRQGTRLTMLAAGLFAGPTIAASRAFLHAWMGASFAAAATTNLRYLTAAWMFFCATIMPVLTLLGLGRARAVTLSLAAISAVGVGLAWWLVQEIGRNGAALAMMLSMGLSPVLLLAVHVRLCHSLLDGLASLLRIALPAAMAWAITTALVAVLPWSLLLVLAAMGIGALGGLAMWALVPALAGRDRLVFDAALAKARGRLAGLWSALGAREHER